MFKHMIQWITARAASHTVTFSPPRLRGGAGGGVRALALAALILPLLAGSISPALAQDGEGQGGDYDVKIVQIDTSKFPEVTVWISVTDAQGNPVRIVPANDFTLLENGQPVEFTEVHQAGDQGPVSAVLTIDRSGSMIEGDKLGPAKAAAKKFVELMRPQDQTGLIAFNTQVDILQPLTSDKAALNAAIDGIEAFNDTAMYDALAASTDMLSGVSGRRAIIILSDGLDNSSASTADDILGSMQSAETSVYAIGLGDPAQGNSRAGIDEAALQSIADQSRGAYSFAPGPADLEALYAGISYQIQSEYQLTYISGNSLRDGVNRGLEVKLAQGAEVAGRFNPGGVIPETSNTLSWGVFGGLMVVLVVLLALPDVLRGGGGLAKALTPKKKSKVKLTSGGSAQSGGKAPGKSVPPDAPKSKSGANRPSVRVGKRG